MVIGGIAGLIALLFGAHAVVQMRNPEKHNALIAAKTWPNNDQLDTNIATQLKDKANTVQLSKYKVTKNFIVQKSMFTFSAHHMHHMLWAYKGVTQKKIYYVIPAGKTFAAHLNLVTGDLVLNGNEKKVDQVLAMVATHAPHTITGYSDELQKMYAKNRNGFVEEVARRKVAASMVAEAAANEAPQA